MNHFVVKCVGQAPNLFSTRFAILHPQFSVSILVAALPTCASALGLPAQNIHAVGFDRQLRQVPVSSRDLLLEALRPVNGRMQYRV